MASTSFALALTGDQVVAALARPDLADALVACGAAFTVIGADRLDGPLPRGARTIDSAIAASHLAGRGVRGLLSVATLEREHPYAIARQIASLDHHAVGTGGVVLGLRDRFSGPAAGGVAGPGTAARAEVGTEADANRTDAHGGSSASVAPPTPRGWAGAALDEGVPLDARTLDDAARVLQELWQSWPIDSVVGDRETGIFTCSDEIRRVDHEGVYDVAGPLGVPSTPQGAPVLARLVRDADEAAGISDDIDLAIVSIAEADARDRVLDALPRRESLAVFVTVDLDGDLEAVEALAGSGRCDGVVLSAGGTGGRAFDGAAGLERLLAAAGARGDRRPDVTTLRARLGLPGPRPLLADAPRAFPAPTPLY